MIQIISYRGITKQVYIQNYIRPLQLNLMSAKTIEVATYICTYVGLGTHIHTHVHACIYTHTDTHTHRHTHTHTHTHTHKQAMAYACNKYNDSQSEFP